MARDAVDVAARDLGRPVPPSVTEHLPLLGAAGLQAVTNRAASIASHSGVPVELVRRMIGRYGDLLEDVLAPVALQPELAQPVPGAPQHVLADILYAVTHEGARHLDDVLGRRTRISVDTSHRGTKSAQAVADLVAPVLGWGPEVVEREVSAYIARVEQEIASQRALNDEQAQTLRSAAPDLRRFAVDQRDRRSSRFPASS